MTDVATTDPVVAAYARAIHEIAKAEGAMERVEDELFRFARAVEGNAELTEKLVDARVDAGAKIGVVTDLLAGRAHPQTVAAVIYVVQAGKARRLVEIADAVVAVGAGSRSHVVAEVRSATALDGDQQRRLTAAVGQALGAAVDLRVVLDDSIVGGLVVRVGDTVVDGSVARRLTDLRAALTHAS